MAFQLRRSVMTHKNNGKDEGGAFVPRATVVQQNAKNVRRTLAAQLRRRFHSAGTMGKILLAYFQVLNAFSQLPSLKWPPRFAAFLDRLSFLSFELFSVSPLSSRLAGPPWQAPVVVAAQGMATPNACRAGGWQAFRRRCMACFGS